jgi:hypothetical protein
MHRAFRSMTRLSRKTKLENRQGESREHLRAGVVHEWLSVLFSKGEITQEQQTNQAN